MNIQDTFADRIGGVNFGKIQKIFKFTLIDNAKKQFLAEYPNIKLIDMGVGEPEEMAPQNVIEVLYQEAQKKENRIYPCNGTIEFKQAVSRYLKRLIGVDFDPATEIVHCMGAKNGLAQLPLAFVNQGDTVVSTAPGYPVLPTMVEYLGGKMSYLKLTAANKYLPDLKELRSILSTTKIKLLLLNYPNNPTGALANLEFFKEVVDLAHQHNFVIVQDAAYSDHCFTENFCSPFQVPGGKDVTIELYSLSKSYNMQGFRLGFVVSNKTLLNAFSVVKDNTDNGQFIAIQKAGVEALDNSQAFLATNSEKYKSRLEKVVQAMNRAGLKAEMPGGTFYLYCAVPENWHNQTFASAQAFSDFLISSLGVVSVPWAEAGPYVRLSMTFEVGNKDFKSEDELIAEFERRLVSGKI